MFSLLVVIITSCVPCPEELAGVTREELENGKAVEKVLTIQEKQAPSIEESRQTLEQAHEKEIVDIAENAWDGMRPNTFDDGTIEASIGQKFIVNVK